MNEFDFVEEHGTIELAPNRRRYDPFLDPTEVDSGQRRVYPMRYVDIIFLSEKEKEERRRPRVVPVTLPTHLSKKCARCYRAIKPQYTHCYRCNNYLNVKRRIAKGA